MRKELLRKIEERDKEIESRLKSIVEKIDKMSGKELDVFLGLTSTDLKWKHPELSGSELVRKYRQVNDYQRKDPTSSL